MTDTYSTITERETTSQRVLAPTREDAHWLKSYWRPVMAWQYMIVCFFDFVVAPVLVMSFYAKTGQVYAQWVPLTLQGNGLYHLAMGAVLGITSWTRGQEKIKELSSSQ